MSIQDMLHRERIVASEARTHQVATSEILDIIARSPEDEQPVFDAIAENARRLIGAIDAAVYRAVDGMLHLTAFTSASQAGDAALRGLYPAPVGTTNAGRAVLTRAPSYRADVEADPDILPAARKVAQARGYRSMLAVPMLHRGVGIGSISVSRQESGPFREYHIGLLETFADQAVIAIENVWLFKELQKRTDALARREARLAALNAVSSAMNSMLDPDTVLQTIVQHTLRLTGLDNGAVFEYDERTAEFHLRASDRLAPEMVEALRRTSIYKGGGMAGALSAALAPTQAADIVADIYQGNDKNLLVNAGNSAVLAVPLLRAGRVLGALAVGRAKPGPIAAEAVELLEVFAVQAAIALYNARLRYAINRRGRPGDVA